MTAGSPPPPPTPSEEAAPEWSPAASSGPTPSEDAAPSWSAAPSSGPAPSETSAPTWQAASTPPPAPSGSRAAPTYSAGPSYNPSAGPAASATTGPSFNAASGAPAPSGSQSAPTYSAGPSYNPSAGPAPSLTTGPSWAAKPSVSPSKAVAPTWSHLASLNQSLTAAPTGPTQVADTTPLGSSPTHFTPPSPKAETDDPPITSNFYLIIDGITLGRWSECSGLGMKYKGQVYQQGGSITSTQYLLQKDIQTLTVTRPFGSPSMEMLHWFELYAHITIPLTATVLACDYTGKPVYYWELDGVVPIEWDGPKFKAGEAAPCMETLKLTYTDFLAYGTVDAAGAVLGALEAAATVGEAVIGLLGAPSLAIAGSGGGGFGSALGSLTGNSINFTIVPNSFTISSSVKIQQNTGAKAGAASTAQQSGGKNARTLQFEFVLDCLTLGLNSLANPLGTLASAATGIEPQLSFLAKCTGDQLWTGGGGGSGGLGALGSAIGSLAGGGSSAAVATSPQVQFSWGDFNFVGWVKSCTIKIIVLSLMGTPQRANVNITIQEVTPQTSGQNPTSGAEGASHTHTVIAGDTLASIAYQAYGHADRWRGIAELNGIDDPLRLRPGSTLLLPTYEDAKARK